MKKHIFPAVLMLAAALMFIPQAGAAQAAGLAGKWKLTVETPGGPESMDCVIEQNAAKITVKWSGEGIEFKGQGTVKDSAVEWKMVDERMKGEVPFSGTITSARDGQAVEMSGQLTMPNGAGTLTWKAVRAEN